ncbi:hypothetical protein B0A48_01311 [Cryoendolithus antarcticus]|uniref:Uncharacterized protein n=1 Tax=Cryoendolithus antarcticus TaxID=1507870 RepID=A0A1V8TSX4_9PEZI|nr:hypothetical protein B0A48_01311 [Cryoendolithus antarcticus]
MSVSAREFCSMHGGWSLKIDFERKGKLYKTCNSTVPDLIPDLKDSLGSSDSSPGACTMAPANGQHVTKAGPVLLRKRTCSFPFALPSSDLPSDASLRDMAETTNMQGPGELRGPLDIEDSVAAAREEAAFEFFINENPIDEPQDTAQLAQHEERQAPHDVESNGTCAQSTVLSTVEEQSDVMDTLSFGLGQVSLYSQPAPSTKRTWTSSNRSIISHWSPGMAAPMATEADDELLIGRNIVNYDLRRAMWKLGPAFNNDRKLRDEMISCIISGGTDRIGDILATGRCNANTSESGELKAMSQGPTVLEFAVQFENVAAIEMLVERGKPSMQTLQRAAEIRRARMIDCVRSRDSNMLLVFCNMREVQPDVDCSVSLDVVHAAIKMADLRTARALNAGLWPRPRGDQDLYDHIMTAIARAVDSRDASTMEALVELVGVVNWRVKCQLRGPGRRALIMSLLKGAGDAVFEVLVEHRLIGAEDRKTFLDVMGSGPGFTHPAAASRMSRIKHILLDYSDPHSRDDSVFTETPHQVLSGSTDTRPNAGAASSTLLRASSPRVASVPIAARSGR